MSLYRPHWSDFDGNYYLGDTSDSDNGDYSDDDAGDYDDYYSFNDDEEGRASQVPTVCPRISEYTMSIGQD